MPPSVALDLTPASTHGHRGIGRYVRGLYRALATTDPEWVASKLGLLVSPGYVAEPPPASAWCTTHWTARPADLFWPARLVADRLALRSAHYEIWHGTDPRAPRPPLRGAAAIETAYDLIPLRHKTPAMRFPHRRFFYREYLRRLKSADVVVCISQTTADDVIRTLEVAPSRVRIVPPVIEAPPKETTGAAADDRIRLLYVGALVAHKRPVLALETAAALVGRGADVVIRFAGLAPAPARAALETRSRELGMTSRVEILGPVDEETLWTDLRGATVLLFPSMDEGFGLPPLEAMSVGTPVIAADTPIARETLFDGALLVPPESDAFANAVERVVEDASLRVDLRTRGALRAAEYSPAAIADRMLGIYSELGARVSA